MSTHIVNGTEYCKACGCDLTLTRKMDLAHECDKSDLYSQAMSYRRMLEDICNVGVDPMIDLSQETEVNLSVETLNQARELLGWEKLP